ncbi:hypothetical protein BJ741DRAFT_589035 [Chytriomyces cf. hyalinus JEL632]|nr:hypothetical protein BJ741DRAFT_589035 [Chytriomyces cf. hyalinus JEL632]
MNERIAANEKLDSLQKQSHDRSSPAIGRSSGTSSHPQMSQRSSSHSVATRTPQTAKKPFKMRNSSAMPSDPDANDTPWTALVRERIPWFRSNRSATSRALCQRAFEFIHKHDLKGSGRKAIQIPFPLVDEFKQFMEDLMEATMKSSSARERANVEESDGDDSESGFEGGMEPNAHCQIDATGLDRSDGSSSTQSMTRYTNRKSPAQPEQHNDGFDSHPSSPGRSRYDSPSSPGELNLNNLDGADSLALSDAHAKFKLKLDASSAARKRAAEADVKLEEGLVVVQKKARMQAPDYQQNDTHFEWDDSDQGSDSESKMLPEPEPVMATSA